VLPAYGAVWVPAVAPGWAPYRFGHWVWVDPWGWTWVDDAPWGFAPCHYGRWVYYNNYWGWVPGPVAVRPVYAPALVAWVGGSHWGLSLSFGGGGGVGWFPLGYGEPYIPPYRASRNYFQNVNVTNTHITNITNVTNNYYTNNNTTVINHTNVTKIVYKNQMVPGAFTAVPKAALMNAQPVSRAAVQVPVEQLRNAPLATAPEVAPSKASVLGARVGAVSSMPPRQFTQRPVVARMAPPEKPIPFSAKQEALERNPGRPLDRDTENQIRARVGQPGARPARTLPAQAANPEPVKAVTVPAQRPVPAAVGSRPVPMPAQRANVGDGAQAPNIPVAAPQPVTKAPGRMETADDRPARVVPHPPSRSDAPVQPGQNFPSRVVPRPPDRSIAARPQPAVVDRTAFPSAGVRSNDQPSRTNDNPGPRVQQSAPNPMRDASPQGAAAPQQNEPRRVESAPAPAPARVEPNRSRSEVMDRPADRPAPRVENPPRNVEQPRRDSRPVVDQLRPQAVQTQPQAVQTPHVERTVDQPRRDSRPVEQSRPQVQAQPQPVQTPHIERTASQSPARTAPAKRAEPRSDGEHKQGKEQR
jgi:hypothetical protein